ncbi:ankyrin repeat-containing domain protein [Nemania sp. FL0031]|nr:ankyrin repeat-containing domain protein [Nemania sp. FL0031]
MDEDIIKPPVAYRLTGVVPYNGSPPEPANTRLFIVNGLRSDDPVHYYLFEDDLPYSNYIIESDYLRTPSPEILGRDTVAVKALESRARNLLNKVKKYLGKSDYCVFWADDLGGSIAKLALVIAAEEAEYRKILDATQAIVFFGTPHRGSSDYSLDSAVYSVVRACFQGILGDWFPETLNSISRSLEEIDRKFRRIAHKFSVVSCYQEQPASNTGSYQVVVPKECATLGLETEATIGVSRAYSEMRTSMNYHEARVARVFLENSKIRHWDEFRYYMDILQPPRLGTEYDDWLSKKSPTPSTSLYRNNPDFLGWISPESVPRYLNLSLKSPADSAGLLSAAAKAIWQTPDALWIACPSITLSDSGSDPPGKGWILASLIHQLLTQQPRAFLHIRHLLPNLVDAMCSDIQTWKERCLWLCLRTLMHAPIGVSTYGFLHVETKDSIEILRRIDSALEGTESRWRLVLVLAPGVETGIGGSHFVHLNLPSNDGRFDNTGIMVIREMPRLPRSDLEGLLLQHLRLSLRVIERADFIALTWIAFATRPLSLEELEAAAALDQVQRSGAGSVSSEGSPLGYEQSPGMRLQNFLPDIVEVDSNRALLRLPYKLIREVLLSSKPPGHSIDEDWSPHLYLAEKCLGLVKGILESTHDQLAISFTAYAACNWIYHYERASIINNNPTLGVSQAYSDTIEEFNVQSWLSFVEHLSLPPSQRKESSKTSLNTTLKIAEPRLKRVLDAGSIKDLKALHKLASRPSTLCGIGRLLVYAAETTNNDILERIYTEPLSSEQAEGILRALATSHGTVHDALMNKAVSILDEQMIFRMQLEAHVLGNTAISGNLASKLTLLPGAGERGLAADVLIAALEYGDEEAVADVCNSCRDAPWRHKISLTRSLDDGSDLANWSVLHAAAKYGSEKAVSSILGLAFLNNISGIRGPQSPLFIAAARGFPRIVDCLVSSKALVNGFNGDRGMSALHVSSLLGHWETVNTLLLRGADPTTFDNKDEYPLHLAIRQGHSRVAQLLVQHFPNVPEHYNQQNYGISVAASDRDIAPEHGTMLDFIYAPLNCANMDGVGALVQAVDGELADVCRLILQQGGDPNIQDDDGRIALHLAARAGSADMVRDLIERGSITDKMTSNYRCTPVHYACYRGATEIVDLLMGLTDLSVRDSWGRTPISAAAYAGHLGTVKLLYESYDDPERVRALCAAAGQCHCDVVEYLLNSGCSIDGVSPDFVPLLQVSLDKEIMIRLLAQRGAYLWVKDVSGEQAIHKAAENGTYEVTKLLLDCNSPLETETTDGRTPLVLAIYRERPKVVRLLLEQNAKIRLPRRWSGYSSVLDFAMDMSSSDVVAILIEYYIEGRHQDGLTCGKALVEATNRRRDDVINFILDTWVPSHAAEAIHYLASDVDGLFDHGALLTKLLQNSAGIAAINAKMPSDLAAGTPLHAAILKGNKIVMDILLKMGADRNAASDRYGTILHTACVSGYLDVVRDVLAVIPKTAISTVAGKYGTPFQSAVYGFSQQPENIIDVFKLLEEHGASPSVVGGYYSTPLHAAVELGCPLGAVVWLMERSSHNLLSVNVAGRTPLSIAILQGSLDVARAVFEKTRSLYPSDDQSYASVFFPDDRQNLTLMHYAVMSQSSDMVAGILSWTKEAPEDSEDLLRSMIITVDIDGWAPLHWACRRESSDIVNILLGNNAYIEVTINEGWTPRQIAILHGFEDAEYIKSLGATNDEAIANDRRRLPRDYYRQGSLDCSVCFTRLNWTSHYCQNDNCSDFVLCFKCYKHSERIYFEGHEFRARVPRVED